MGNVNFLDRWLRKDWTADTVGPRSLPDLLPPRSPRQCNPHWHARKLLRKKGKWKLETQTNAFRDPKITKSIHVEIDPKRENYAFY